MKTQLRELATNIDLSIDRGDLEALNSHLATIDSFLSEEADTHDLALLHFYAANCYSAIRIIKEGIGSWEWQNQYLEKEIYCLRLALNKCHIEKLEAPNAIQTDLEFRVGTNLANALNLIGRFVEAIETWDMVLEASPSYGMALSNKGLGLIWYARCLYDPGHQPLFFNESYKVTQKALQAGIEAHAILDVQQQLSQLESLNDWENFSFEPEQESRGATSEEKQYRTWCLDNRLFLNPLNDLWNEDIAANDVLTFPSVFVAKDDSAPILPEVYGIYNQLKQEYVSARYILFEAIKESEQTVHFSDKRVLLYDMLDYRHYRLWIEKLKMAFLSVYTIFDKIAYLVNEYWQLGLPIRKVSFGNVWFKNADQRQGLAEIFEAADNWPLRGLFWVSKDLFFKKTQNQPMEPDARHLNHIRNHIAHKYLKVYDDSLVDTAAWREFEGHELSYPISNIEFITQTLKLIKLVRSALIYMSLAAHDKETKAQKGIDESLIGEMKLYEVDDDLRF